MQVAGRRNVCEIGPWLARSSPHGCALVDPYCASAGRGGSWLECPHRSHGVRGARYSAKPKVITVWWVGSRRISTPRRHQRSTSTLLRA
jgi:hypothetical protein